MKQVILNSSNSRPLGDDLSRFVYDLPSSVYFAPGSQVAISSISLYFSWFSITSQQNNNVFNYRWPDNLGIMQPYSVVLSDGSYSISDINAFLQSVMISNGHYLLGPSGDNVYYLQLSENATAYSIQYDAFPIPTALPLGFSNPSGLVFPPISITPQLDIAANSFREIIGFNAGLYPTVPIGMTYSVLSQFTPQVSVVSNVVLKTNIVNNEYSNPSDVIYSFSPDVSFGSVINPKIQSLIWNTVSSGYYTEISIQFCDQNYDSLMLRDTNVLITLVLRDPEDRI